MNPLLSAQKIIRKGIVLAGGSGTRLYPLTLCVSKQLLPVYDKPTLYYPLATLMSAGISDLFIISTPSDLPRIQNLLGSGTEWGVRFTYQVQEQPRGIAEAFLLAEQWIQGEPVCLILGDNLFYGQELDQALQAATQESTGATVFAYRVEDPERYGVIEFDPQTRQGLSIEEKPRQPKSPWAVTGLYCYDAQVCQWARELKPSQRGELEITDINQRYLEQKTLRVVPLGRGVAWLDTGTQDTLLGAALFVQTLEKRQGVKIACPEEIAYQQGWIDQAQLHRLAQKYGKSAYGHYLQQL